MKVQLKAAISDSKDGPWREGGGRLLDSLSLFLFLAFFALSILFLRPYFFAGFFWPSLYNTRTERKKWILGVTHQIPR